MSEFRLRKIPKYKIVFAVTDVLTLLTCFLIAVYIHRRETQVNFVQFFTINESLIYILFALSIIFAFIFQYNGLYRINVVLSRAAHFANIIKSQYYGALNVVLVSLLLQSYDVVDARLIIFTYLLVVVPTLYLIRVELLRELFIQLRDNSFRRNVVIVGDGKSGKLLAAKLLLENHIGIEIVGFVDDTREINEEIVNGKRVLGKITDLSHVISDYKVDEIIVAIDGDDHEKLFGILDYCKMLNLNVRLTSELFEIVTQKVDIEKYIDIPVVDVSTHYNNRFTLAMKRVIDIGISSLAILILSPIIILIALMIKINAIIT